MKEHMLGIITRRKKYQIEAFGYRNTKDILTYGKAYSSRNSETEEGLRNNFTLMFKRAVVHIDLYDMKHG